MPTTLVLLSLVTLATAAAKSHTHYPLAYNVHHHRHRTGASGLHRTSAATRHCTGTAGIHRTGAAGLHRTGAASHHHTGPAVHHHARAAGRHIPYLNCLSWRLGVEANNIRDWPMVPHICEGYIGHYMLGRQYRDDCTAVAAAAIHYASAVELVHDGKDVWVFDIDETALSNLPYYARVDIGFGKQRYNETKFEEWIRDAKAPAMQETLRLYNKVLALGIKPVFISGTKEEFRPARVLNLRNAGFKAWEMLILRGANDTGPSMVEYKSEKRTELVEKGYRIIGNIGDQWSDLLGGNVGLRTFKMPDPMYYVS